MSVSKRKEPPVVTCDYCGGTATLMLSSAKLYRGRDFGPVWFCGCEASGGGAWVGTHINSPIHKPLGRLANADLRKAKQAAHAAFDPLWKARQMRDKREGKKGSKNHARGDGYYWLSQQLGIRFEDCHIGMFDVAMCQRVVQVCTPFLPDMKSAI